MPTTEMDGDMSAAIFRATHALWLTLQQGLTDLITGLGGSASIGPFMSAL